jgi:C4-dicarboxylate-specific signal transduction histidine kinase
VTTRPEQPHRPRPGLFAGLAIRKKLIVLHTAFSLVLVLFLALVLRQAVGEVVERAESSAGVELLRSVAAAPTPDQREQVLAALARMEGVEVASGPPDRIGIDPADAARALASPGVPVVSRPGSISDGSVFLAVTQSAQNLYKVRVLLPRAREAVTRLYVFTLLALLLVYAIIAATMEAFVLPRHVYSPIRSMLDADEALRTGQRDRELVPPEQIPADELGQIIRSRNQSIAALRSQEAQLADALGRLEAVANDLKTKNHLLETARRNLADADRLASLGMMSAGIAHELNTPLAVIKGLAERLAKNPQAGLDPPTAALMLRVVQRLERLGESLLDFARARPPSLSAVRLHETVDEAASLVRLDRGRPVDIINSVNPDLIVPGDPDRLVQILVNLIRNARDALTERRETPGARVEILASALHRDGRDWVSLAVRDNGPGIDPALLPRLFEPFASTRLDSKGTGLGLAVAEGIAREHGGVLLARNLPGGAEFELVLPANQTPDDPVRSPSPSPTNREPTR